MKIMLLLTTVALLFVFCQNESEPQPEEYQVLLRNFSVDDSVRLDLHITAIPLEVHLYAAPSPQNGMAVDVYDTVPAGDYG